MLGRVVRLALALCALIPVGAAQAFVPGHWDPITSANGDNIDQIATARTADGRLHVIWHHHDSASTDALEETIVQPGGSVGAPVVIVSGWAGVGDAVALRDSTNEILVFAGGTRSASATDPLNSIEAWVTPQGGQSWVQPVTAAIDGGGFDDPVGGAIGPDGKTAFVAWGTTDGLFLHRTGDPVGTSLNLQQAAGFGCCGYDPGVALDSGAGTIVVAWYAIVGQGNAVYARTVDPASGAATGTTMRMPGTLDSVSPDQRVGLTGRRGQPGVFAAYNGGGASQSSVLVWRVGAATATTLATDHSTELRNPTITATPDGRLWVAWSAHGRIWARRSNLAGTQWGSVVSIPVRSGTGTVYKVALDATTSSVDVFGAFAPLSGSGVQTWHSRLLPGLTLALSPAKLSLAKGKKGSVKVSVSDAGAAVAGVKVTVAGHSAKTNKKGTAHVKVGPLVHGASLNVVATRSGYMPASTRLRVSVH